MNKSIKITALCLTAVLIMTACTSKETAPNSSSAAVSASSEPSSSSSLPPQEITQSDILSKMNDSEKNWMNLTKEQYLEDFDSLYKQMQENYPYFGVVLRKTGGRIEDEYIEYRKKMESCTNDVDFFEIVRKFISKMDYTGHLDTWGTRYTDQVKSFKQLIIDFPEYEEQLRPYIKKMDNPVSEKNYTAMTEFYNKIQSEVDAQNEKIPKTDTAPQQSDDIEESYKTVETKIIEKDKIAYIKINGFDMGTYKADKEIILPFYKEVSGYDNLIIDITENGGGGMSYFDDLIAAPLIKKPLSVSTYMLIKGGDVTREILQIDKGLAEGFWEPISKLPTMPDINQEDLKEMAYFSQENYTVKPLYENGFEGKIWLLVSENNYSSSEYAAMFSKHSGFATLVGETTGGDGIGTDPAYMLLPNSGIIVQYSAVYGITQDGRSSEEYGTTPDYFSKENETELEACLRLIKEGK